MIMPRVDRPLVRQRGVALIELALMVPVLLMLLLAIVDFSPALFQYDTLLKATRSAARYLSTQAPGDAAAQDVAACLAVYGSPTCAGTPLAPGLSTSMVVICDSTGAAGCSGEGPFTLAGGIQLVEVKIVGFGFQPAVSFTAWGDTFGLPPLTFAPIATVMRQG